jgi:hypothetical protein
MNCAELLEQLDVRKKQTDKLQKCSENNNISNTQIMAKKRKTSKIRDGRTARLNGSGLIS